MLEAARERAADHGHPILVSVTERLPVIDPLLAIERVKGAASANPMLARLLAEGCMYWSNPRDEIAIAGMGAAVAVEPTGDARFALVDAAWESLLEDAMASGADTAASPLMMGGFAFDADGPASPRWGAFGVSWMFVPRLAIASRGTDHRLSMSVMVSADSDIAEMLDLWRTLRNAATTESHGDADRIVPAEPLVLSAPRSEAEWSRLVDDAVTHIRRGEFEKVVLARAVDATASRCLDAGATLRQLRAGHPDAFVFGIWRGDRVFVGASPERLASVDGRHVKASSLAGTARRGATDIDDDELAAQLVANPKERAEHAAVRDSLLEKLTSVCDEISAPREPSLLTLPHLHHLHTEVNGRLQEGCSLLDVVAMLHPTPAVGGTPRDAALAFIDANECLDRGWYAAPVGWLGREAGEFAVALRCALIAGDHATLYAGCGIVEGSDPTLEYAESQLKLNPIRLAIEAALAGETR